MELMVATSILAIGLVLVARALLTASVALDSADNRIRALRFLQAKMTDVRQQASIRAGLQPGRDRGTTELNRHSATWVLEIVPVEVEGSEASVTEVRLSLSWQEGVRKPEVALVTYLERRNVEGAPDT